MSSIAPSTASQWLETELHRLEKNDSTLIALNLSVMGIEDVQAQNLVKALDKNTVLRLLILYENRITKVGAKDLGALLKHNVALEELWLPFNNIGNEGAVWLAKGLQHNTSIKTLRLDGNRIGPEGATVIGQCLKHGAIQELHLSENCIGDVGAKGLVAGLMDNTTVKKLHVSDNHIGNDGAIAFGQLLKTNRSLRSLYLGLNAFDKMGASALVQGMEQNFSLETFSLFGMDSLWQSEINYHLQLNKVGRRILREHNIPMSLWADFLGRLCKKGEAQLVHYFVLAKPDLFQSCYCRLEE